MNLPTLEKTWQYNVNIPSDNTGTDEGDINSILLKIKDALLGFTGSPWEVVGSSDSITFNMVGIDLWNSSPSLVHDFAAPHSWIVLKQTGISANTSICIDLDHPTVTRLTLVFSPAAGFTGGDGTSRPTATDENVMFLRDFWFGTWGGSGHPLRAHVWQSNDGECTRLITASDNEVRGFWLIDRPANPVSGWTDPAICMATADKGAGNTLKYTNWFNTGAGVISAEGPVTTMPLFITAESKLAWPYPSVPSVRMELNNEIGLCPLGLFHNVTAGQRGRHGGIFDFWSTSSIPTTGDSFDDAGSHELAIFDDFVLPWNGTNILNT